MNTKKLNQNIQAEAQHKRMNDEQKHRDLVENKIFGQAVAEKRREAEKLFQTAMEKVTTLVDEKKNQVKRPDTMTMVDNLSEWAKKNPKDFWDKVRDEFKFAGACGIQDLFGLATANTILDDVFQNNIKALHEYGMTLSAPLTTLGTEIFYHINKGNDVSDLMEELTDWEPEGWKAFEQNNKENK
jgi:hypothetical protein